MQDIYILGLSCFYHDSAACLLKNGEIVAAAQQERFSRKKHDFSFPRDAVNYCLKEGKISVKNIYCVAFYDKPFLKFERLLETYLTFSPKGAISFIRAMTVWLKQKLWIKDIICKELKFQGKVIFPKHHESHAASAFFPSPFQEAAFLTMDAVGEWTTTSYGTGKSNQLKMIAGLDFPHSLGLFYSAFTYYTGFKVNSGEYKLMGLAPYGEPKYKDIILSEIIDIKEDGSFRLNMSYFDYCSGLTMTSKKFHKLFGGPPRKPESEITQKEMDLARSIQEVTEDIVIRIAKQIKKETGQKYLCLAGGVALNCVSNGKLLRENLFDDIWIQPAAGDAGGALGAALVAWYQYLGHSRNVYGKDFQKGSYLGPDFSNEEIKEYLNGQNIPYEKLIGEDLTTRAVDILINQNVLGWFQGRMEFGPRALGNRSILGDARSSKMQKIINLKIKFRESFRPFAPSVLAEKASAYFKIDRESPYMLLVANVKENIRSEVSIKDQQLSGIDKLKIVRSTIPAVTHVDCSARLQTVNKKDNILYHKLIEEFEKRTGCPVVINTSFNVRGEPIVCTPQQAYLCFMRTEMDYLIMGNFLLDKKKQSLLKNDINWKNKFKD